MFLSYLCSVQLLSAYHKLHVFIAIYCTASLQLSWHLFGENKMDFTPLLHIYPTSIPVHRTPFLSVTVGCWWASFNISAQAPVSLHVFGAKCIIFQAWTFNWNGLCLVHQISQQGREKGQMALLIGLYFEESSRGASGSPGHPSCGYVEIAEEGELTRFWSIYFISIITAEACDRNI